MARIIVTADPIPQGDAPVVLEESVSSVHLSTGHAATQLVERIAWAIADAEDHAARRETRQAPMPASIQRRKRSTSASGHGPSQGIE